MLDIKQINTLLTVSKKLLFFIGSLLFSLAIIVTCLAVPLDPAELENDVSEQILLESDFVEETLINEPILFLNDTYKVFYDTDMMKSYLTEILSKHSLLADALASESYTDFAISIMEAEALRLQGIAQQLANDIEKYSAWEDEYYYATKTFEFLKQKGYNDAVICGIIGNMMIETAGGTLSLEPNIYNPDKTFYGLCQWSIYYYPETKGLSFEQQLNYLVESMSYEFNTFGKLYKKGFTLDTFTSLTDPAEAALAFAVAYERCTSRGYIARQEAAIRAYRYFTN